MVKLLIMKNKVSYFMKSDGVSNLKKSLNDAGDSITDLISTSAKIIFGVATAVAGLVLLFMAIRCYIKVKGGQDDAWDDAKDTIMKVGAITCFSAAVFAAFF